MQPRQRNVQKSVMHVQSWLLLAELSRAKRAMQRDTMGKKMK